MKLRGVLYLSVEYAVYPDRIICHDNEPNHDKIKRILNMCEMKLCNESQPYYDNGSWTHKIKEKSGDGRDGKVVQNRSN